MQPGPSFDPYAVLQVVPTADQVVINAAFRALALKYHPDRDRTRRAAEHMAALNRAYALVRDPRARADFDASHRTTIAGVSVPTVMRGATSPPGTADSSVVTFGRYAGWSLRDIARRDPDYILWLSRHSSGIRYRTEIYGILRTLGVSAA
jgi:curved DNA-binding protein CbpA